MSKAIEAIEAILEKNDGINLKNLYTSIFDNVKNLNNDQLEEIGKDFDSFLISALSGGTRRKTKRKSRKTKRNTRKLRKTKRKMRRVKGKSRKYWDGIGGDDHDDGTCPICLGDFSQVQINNSISLEDLPNINIPNNLPNDEKPILRHTIETVDGATSHYFHGKCLYDWFNERPIGQRNNPIRCIICQNMLSSNIVRAVLEKYATANDIVEFNRLQIRSRRETYLRSFVALMCILLTGLLFYLLLIELGNNGLNSLNAFFIRLVNLFLPMLRNFDNFNVLIRLFSDTIRENYPALWYILCLHDPAFCGNHPLILRGGNVNVNEDEMKYKMKDEIEDIKNFLIKMLTKLIEYNKSGNTEEIQKFISFLKNYK
jgi:hypothetical protein